MLNFNSVMIGSTQPEVLQKFYEQVFTGITPMKDGGFWGWKVGSAFISVGEHSEAQGKAKDPARIMLCLETVEVKEEFERISQIEGAEVVKEPYEIQGMWIATLADPDGNYFQLMMPWEGEMNG